MLKLWSVWSGRDKKHWKKNSLQLRMGQSHTFCVPYHNRRFDRAVMSELKVRINTSLSPYNRCILIEFALPIYSSIYNICLWFIYTNIRCIVDQIPAMTIYILLHDYRDSYSNDLDLLGKIWRIQLPEKYIIYFRYVITSFIDLFIY